MTSWFPWMLLIAPAVWVVALIAREVINLATVPEVATVVERDEERGDAG